MTMDETWIYHFTLESNRQSAEWIAAGESHSKWPKIQTSADKVLASVFWDVQGILFINYLEKGKTINSEYYIALLVCFGGKKSPKNYHKWRRKKYSFTKKDSALCHELIAIMAKLHKLHFELLLHPPYSPDLTSSHYWLFTDCKRMFQGKIWLQWRRDIGNWDVFWGQRQIVLQKRHWIVREALKSVYHPRRRLCWWIKSNFA